MATPPDPRAVLERTARPPPAPRPRVGPRPGLRRPAAGRAPAGRHRRGGPRRLLAARVRPHPRRPAVAGVRRRRLHRRRARVPPGRHARRRLAGHLRRLTAALAAVRADPTLPDRCVLVGHSAGGHLALWAASQPWAHGLAGAVSLAGCVDLTLTATLGLGDRAAAELMGGDPEGALPRRTPPPTPPGSPPPCRWSWSRDAGRRRCRRRSPAPTRSDAGPGRPPAAVQLVMVPGGDHFELIDPDHPAFARCSRRSAPSPLRLAP